ncbi:MAG: response regulator [Roseinatronobacter sp.]
MTTEYACSFGAVQPSAAIMPPPPQRGATLLLVEDSRVSCEAIRLMFRGAGGRLRRADCLETARQHLALYTPDAVIVDLGLPDGSGLDLIAELAEGNPRVGRIIALTGLPEMEAAAYAAGADVFIAKPIETVATLRAALTPTFFAPRDTSPMDARPRLANSAIRDDLYLALDLLQQGDPDLRRGYALQFIEGIAHTLSDAPLHREVARVRSEGKPTQLALMLRDRLRAQPVI